MTASGWSVSGSHVSHGAWACSIRSGVMAPPATAVAWVPRGQFTASFRKNPVMTKTSSSSVSSTHFSSAGVGLVGSIGAKTGSIWRPLMPPSALMASKRAVYTASWSPRSYSRPEATSAAVST